MLRTVDLTAQLCVIGGGMAGLSAAISAARCGLQTVLIQERPVLGGNASSENRMWVCGAKGHNNRETGLVEEILLENLYRNPTRNPFLFDSILLDFARREPNLTLLLNTTCMDAETEEGQLAYGRNRRIVSVRAYQMTTQRFFTVRAPLFADCSGDSILAPLCGADFMYGREAADEYGEDTSVTRADNMVMGMSCLLQGRETEQEVPFIPSEFATALTEEDVANRPMDLYATNENFWYLELGGTDGTIEKTEETKEKLQRLSLGVWDHLKNSGRYGAEQWDLDFLGFLPAKRESRRMRGEHVVTQREISDGTVFPDTVAYGGWPLDDHYPGGYYHRGTPNTDIRTPAPYCLPYRALYSANVENLFFAGRNISMTHMAMSSIRVMATCALLGQAVGTAAYLAASYGISPHEVYLSHLTELRQRLMEQDCFLPDTARSVSPLCRATPVRGGSEELKNGQDRPNGVYGTETCGVTVANGSTLEYRFETAQPIGSVHVVFDSDLDRRTLPGTDVERRLVTRANLLRNRPMACLPKTLCRSFRLTVLTEMGERILLEEKTNRKRAYHIPLDAPVLAIRLTVESNWGETDQTNIFSFDFC